MKKKFEKIAIVGGDISHGEKVISYLLAVGGKNPRRLVGDTKNYYYFIDSKGEIDCSNTVPVGYRLAEVLETNKGKLAEKREEVKVNRMTIGDHLFDYQLSLIGKTRPSPLDMDPAWQSTLSMTREQYMTFHDYAVKLMMKVFRIPKSKAIVNFEWYWKQFGIKIH